MYECTIHNHTLGSITVRFLSIKIYLFSHIYIGVQHRYGTI